MKQRFTFLLIFISLCNIILAQRSDKITRVIEYRPAPGQHINRVFPTADMSTTPENALKFAENCLVGNKSMLGLGAFGGYVIVGFDHPIVNVKGEYDFKGLGNAFPGNSEPGIVMVCQDLNKNGKPDADEPWYELAGSEYYKPETIKNYEITYYRPNPDGQKSNIKWTDNQGKEGAITHISYASQSTMYPLWITENTMIFKGTKLKNTAQNKGTDASPYWTLTPFDWGYIDNNSNNDPIEKNGFKIDWAVDAGGNSVELEYVDFIKVYTGQLQEAGWLGETSTELAGIVDLHPDAVVSAVSESSFPETVITVSDKKLWIKSTEKAQEIALYTMQGTLVKIARNNQVVDIQEIERGVYVVKVTSDTRKQLVKKIIIE